MAIAILVSMKDIAAIAIEQIVIKHCHINTTNMSVTVNVTIDCSHSRQDTKGKS